MMESTDSLPIRNQKDDNEIIRKKPIDRSALSEGLLHNTSIKIHDQYIHTWCDDANVIDEHASKILHINNCKNRDDLMKVWIELKKIDKLKNFFIFTIEIENEISDLEKIITTDINYRLTENRCFLVEFINTKTGNVKYFYIKNRIEFAPKEIKLDLSNDEIINSLNDRKFNTEILMNCLNLSILCPKFIIENLDLIKSAIDCKDLLCLKLLSIFDFKLNSQDLSEILKYSADANDLDFFYTLTQFQYDKDEMITILNEILIKTTKNDKNFLHTVIKHRQIKILKFLLKFTSELKNHFNIEVWINLIKFSFEEEIIDAYDIIKNSKFNFTSECDVKANECIQEHDEIISKIKILHKNIENGEIKEIKDFIKDYPNLKICQGHEDMPALEKAAECKNLEIFFHLIENNFYIDEKKLHSCLKRFPKDVREYNIKSSKNHEDFFMYLLFTKCKFSKSSANIPFNVIMEMIKKLCEIKEIKAILKIVAYSNAEFIFEMKNASIKMFDPKYPDGTAGIFYCKDDLIVVAKGNCDLAPYGTFSHESCHLTLFVVYGNDCLPYFKGDIRRETEWKAIVADYKERYDKNDKTLDEIVRLSFSNYRGQKDHEIELAVRAIHMLAEYKDEPEKLQEIEKNHKKLFDFLRNRILPDVEILDGVKLRNKNKSIGILEATKTSQYKTNDKLKVFNKNKNILIKTNVLQLALNEVYKKISLLANYKQNKVNLEEQKSQAAFEAVNIFLDQKTFKESNLKGKDKNILESPTISRIITKIDAKIPENVDFLKEDDTQYIFIAPLDFNDINLKEIYQFQELTIEYKWNDLKIETKDLILNKILNFQGHNIKVKDIFNGSIADEILSQILTESEINLFEVVNQIDNNLYVERKFIKKIKKNQHENRGIERILFNLGLRNETNIHQDNNNFELKEVHHELLISDTESDQIIYISDVAGSGKSWTMKKIQTDLIDHDPTTLVIFVDLKKHLTIITENNFTTFTSFMIDGILGEKGLLEKRTFEEFYEKKKVKILLDGLDEIFPTCRDKVLELIDKFIDDNCGQMWISSRIDPNYEIERKFKISSYKIQSLTEDQQVTIFMNNYRLQNKNTPIMEDFEEISKKLVEKLSLVMKNSSSNLIGFPLQVRMLAEVFADDLNLKVALQSISSVDLSLKAIYKNFLQKKWKILAKEKGKLGEKLSYNAKDEYDENLIKIHRYFAFKHFLPENDICGQKPSIREDKSEHGWTYEEISRCGIISFNERKEAIFLHETLAEFIVADYIGIMLEEDPEKRKSFKKFLKDVLTIDKYANVRMFLNEIVTGVDKKEAHEHLKSFDHDILRIPANEGHFTLCFFLFNVFTLNRDRNDIKRMLDYKIRFFSVVVKDNEDNIFHIASELSNVEVLNELWMLIREVFDNDEFQIKDYLQIKRSIRLMDYLPLHNAQFNRNHGVFEYMFNIYKKYFTIEELFLQKDDEGLNLLQKFAFLDSHEKFQLDWAAIKNYLTDHIMKESFSNLNSKIFLLIVSYSKNMDIFEFLWKILEKYQKNAQNLFYNKDDHGFTIFNFAAIFSNPKIVENIWTHFKRLENSTEKQKKYLKLENKDGENALMLSLQNKNEMFPCMWKIYRDLFNNSELKDFIIKTSTFSSLSLKCNKALKESKIAREKVKGKSYFSQDGMRYLLNYIYCISLLIAYSLVDKKNNILFITILVIILQSLHYLHTIISIIIFCAIIFFVVYMGFDELRELCLTFMNLSEEKYFSSITSKYNIIVRGENKPKFLLMRYFIMFLSFLIQVKMFNHPFSFSGLEFLFAIFCFSQSFSRDVLTGNLIIYSQFQKYFSCEFLLELLNNDDVFEFPELLSNDEEISAIGLFRNFKDLETPFLIIMLEELFLFGFFLLIGLPAIVFFDNFIYYVCFNSLSVIISSNFLFAKNSIQNPAS